jgi:hypothetical protein
VGHTALKAPRPVPRKELKRIYLALCCCQILAPPAQYPSGTPLSLDEKVKMLRHVNAISVAHPLPPSRRVCDSDRFARSKRVDEPPAPHCNPVVGHNHQVRLLKLPIRSLAFPRGKGWRIAVEIGNKMHVVTEVLEHVLQLGWACAPDLLAIVAMPRNYADHLVDIGANEGCHGTGRRIRQSRR